jgi:1-acyl-sn-glycerol-3-phosphate acyltransferase
MTGGPDREAPRAPTDDAPDEVPQASARDASSQPPHTSAGSSAAAVPDPGDSPAGEPGPGGPGAGGNQDEPADRSREAEAIGSGQAGGGEVAGAHGAGRGAGAPKGRGTARREGRNPERGYRIAAAVVKPLMRTWFRIRLEGEEHIPDAGPVILASNHRSNMDPVLLASALRRPVAFMAKAELFVWPLGWILRWIGQFPVRRGGIDRAALRRTDAVLARGSMLGLFPEGTRGDGAFSAVHPGLAYIVVRQRCPVLPVAIFGTERVRRRFGWLPFASPVRIVVGPAIDLPQSTGDRAGRRAASELLRQRLQAFLTVAGGAPVASSISNQSNE